MAKEGFKLKLSAMRNNTSFSNLLKLILGMSEKEQLQLLEYAKSIVEKRILPRRLCLIPADCTVEEQIYNGLILDVNSTGANVDVNAPPPTGQKIVLAFFSPFCMKTIQLSGKIIWKSTHGIGVHFNDWSTMRYTEIHGDRVGFKW